MVPAIWTVRFGTEVGLVVSVAIGASRLATGWTSVVAGAAAVAVALGLWGGFVAPRATRRLSDPARFLTEMALFAWGASGLVLAGGTTAAVVFAVLAVAAAVAIRWAGEPVATDPGPSRDRDPAPEC